MDFTISNKEQDDQFELYELKENDLDPSPFRQFELWFEDAKNKNLIHPNAFTLATSDNLSRPSARMLLLKGIDEKGFVFYTNSESRKGRDLSHNKYASICFWWGKLERQVRVEGIVEELDGASADEYFSSRPRGSQLGAWASLQSSVIESREALESRYKDYELKYKASDVPRPPYWRGYRLIPGSIEFWQGRPDRLHDRLRYRLIEPEGKWVIERLAP